MILDSTTVVFMVILIALGLLGAPGVAFVLLFVGMLVIGVLLAIGKVWPGDIS